ncbi:hypothetical protein [Prevotella sp. 10(H)]|uniref:hypothetical protein n=1 Tax=Prevotella sp. 10(H) TaxID=1158294 RepID=UPI0004A71B23|nr:hypothetical protein [Prevotella sp. 10(H)]
MKKITYIILFLATLFISSCSVYEDIYFMENGSVKYQTAIDASEFMALSGKSSVDMNGKMPEDTLISFSELLKDTLKTISPELEQDIKNIEPLFMRMESSKEQQTFKISIYGDFKDVQSLSDAFNSMNKLQNYIKVQQGKNPKLFSNDYFSHTPFTWDGKTLKRNVIVSDTKDEKPLDEENADGSSGNLDETMSTSFKRLFSQGQMIVRYHFPTKIKSISNDKATFSMDGKTAIINYPGLLFIEPEEELGIEIVTE